MDQVIICSVPTYKCYKNRFLKPSSILQRSGTTLKTSHILFWLLLLIIYSSIVFSDPLVWTPSHRYQVDAISGTLFIRKIVALHETRQVRVQWTRKQISSWGIDTSCACVIKINQTYLPNVYHPHSRFRHSVNNGHCPKLPLRPWKKAIPKYIIVFILWANKVCNDECKQTS